MYSAFDTLDHNFLIPRLSTIGITCIALNWFTSYISNRSSTFRINSHLSPPLYHPWCSPGLCYILDPLLFNIFLLTMGNAISNIFRLHRHFFHTYADDLQLYLNYTDYPTHTPNRLSSCINSIHQWLTSNSLKRNLTKNEAIFLHLPLRSSTLPEPPPSY